MRVLKTTIVLRPTQVRGVNSATVLQLLRKHQRLSRAELARQTGLSEGTVSRIAADLIDRKLIVENGEEDSTGGRPATRLQISSQPLSMGVDVDRWETRFAVGTLRGDFLTSDRIRTPKGPEETLAAIVDCFREYRAKYGHKRLQRIGVCIRGIVNSDSGVVELGNDPSWTGVAMKQRLQAALRVPAFVENNVRAAALAEYHQMHAAEGAGRCFLYVLVSEGVGVGIVLDGQLYAGPRMAAGEFGQMVIADLGGTERHDRPGCFEQLVANPAICDRYARLTRKRISRKRNDSSAAVRRIAQLASEGDAAALETLRVTARYLGLGLANMTWGLDPDIIVVGSSFGAVWPEMLKTIREQMPLPTFSPTFNNLQIRHSSLGEAGPLAGITALPFAEAYSFGELNTIGQTWAAGGNK